MNKKITQNNKIILLGELKYEEMFNNLKAKRRK